MASSAPSEQQQRLPLLYKSLAPLSASQHADLVLPEAFGLDFIKGVHAVPLAVDEFVMAQRHFPIVFAPGDPGTPLALMGLQEGENLFIDDKGNWDFDVYIPAYIRRYPFMLARLTPEAKELSLCFDDQADMLTTKKKGGNLFDGDKPTERTQNILKFCEQFEMSVQRTRQFMKEINDLVLLQPGEATIQQGEDKKANFRGFNMIAEEKLKEMRGDQHRKLVQNGILGLIYAHLFSLSHMREFFARRENRAADAKK